MADKFDVIGLGTVAVDLIGTSQMWPAQGQKVHLQDFSIHDGGLVGTALVAAARLGGSVAYMGKFGNSELANRAIASLRKENIDTSLVIRQENAEPIVSFIVLNPKTGQRTIFWSDNHACYPQPKEIEHTQWFKKTRVLFTDSECGQAGIQAARIARQHHVEVVVDLENIYPYTDKLLSYASHVVVSEDFARKFTKKNKVEEMLKTLQVTKDQSIIITRGDQGSMILDSGNILTAPAFAVDVVDTTGCGDVFHGAYALAIARHYTVPDAVKFASAAAALCATKVGGREGIPTRRQLDDFIKEGYLQVYKPLKEDSNAL